MSILTDVSMQKKLICSHVYCMNKCILYIHTFSAYCMCKHIHRHPLLCKLYLESYLKQLCQTGLIHRYIWLWPVKPRVTDLCFHNLRCTKWLLRRTISGVKSTAWCPESNQVEPSTRAWERTKKNLPFQSWRYYAFHHPPKHLQKENRNHFRAATNNYFHFRYAYKIVKHTHFVITQEKEKQRIITFERVELGNGLAFLT